jgi:flagellar protein FliJ
MKRFQFRLQRVLDLRRQQAETERTHLRNLLAAFELLEGEIRSLAKQLEEARAHVRHAPSAAGEDYIALSYFENHVHRKAATLETRRKQLERQIADQRAHLLQTERKVKLLERLEARRRSEWTAERDKELETISAEAHLARLQAFRRHSVV